MDHQAPSAHLQEQISCPDGQLWVGRRDTTVQGASVIQGLPALSNLLCFFLGDEIVLYAISCMWQLRITVVNSRTLEEY